MNSKRTLSQGVQNCTGVFGARACGLAKCLVNPGCQVGWHLRERGERRGLREARRAARGTHRRSLHVSRTQTSRLVRTASIRATLGTEGRDGRVGSESAVKSGTAGRSDAGDVVGTGIRPPPGFPFPQTRLVLGHGEFGGGVGARKSRGTVE